MNISAQTIQDLKKLYIFRIGDNNLNELPPDRATHISIIGRKDDSLDFIGKTLKTPTKKEVTVEWVVTTIEKALNANTIYASFAPVFEKFLNAKGKNNMSVYPTTYGIGVLSIFNRHASESIAAISAALDSIGVVYQNEYSDAGWSYRFKISKSAENIKKIQSFLNDQQ